MKKPNWKMKTFVKQKSDKYEKFHISDFISPHERCGRKRKMKIWEMKLFNKPLMSRQLSHSSCLIYSILCWARWWKKRKWRGEGRIFFLTRHKMWRVNLQFFSYFEDFISQFNKVLWLCEKIHCNLIQWFWYLLLQFLSSYYVCGGVFISIILRSTSKYILC